MENQKTNHSCGHTCDVYSRVCGYFQPVRKWNIGKQQEFKDRKTFEIRKPEKIDKKGK